MDCKHCKWRRTVKACGVVFATCSNPRVKGKPRIDRQSGETVEVTIFCDVERQFESGCGKAGRFFEPR